MLRLPGSGRIDSTPWCCSQGAAMDGFTACFEGLDDPRTGNAGRHDLLEMLMVALCTVLSARPRTIPRLFPTVHGPLCRGLPRCGGDRWQGAAPLVRQSQRQVGAAYGLRLGL